jgi:hypothetical protein
MRYTSGPVALPIRPMVNGCHLEPVGDEKEIKYLVRNFSKYVVLYDIVP